MKKKKLKAQILIVDDYALVRKALAGMLAREGYDVWEAGNGKETLEILKKNRVDLIVLDQEMPEMHGLHTHSGMRTVLRVCGLHALLQPAMEPRLRELQRQRLLG